MNLTPEEKQFLLQMMSQLNVNPLQPEASAVVAMVQTIAAKLKEVQP